jgi:hypothetical protein
MGYQCLSGSQECGCVYARLREPAVRANDRRFYRQPFISQESIIFHLHYNTLNSKYQLKIIDEFHICASAKKTM